VRYALLGLGNIGAKRREILGQRCVATVDPYNTAADFRDLHELPADRYDAAILAVPNGVKIDLVRLLLESGKHVLIEKPFLLPDWGTAQELHKLARANKVVWYTSYNHRFEPMIETLKSELERGSIGRVYHGRLFYGNGTVANIIGSWREEGMGVLEDLGSHLLDLLGYLFGYVGSEIEAWTLEAHESKCLDHCLLATADHRFVIEASYLSWKNHFEIEIYGEKGSMHLRGLCKWGASEITVHERVRPSGVPHARRQSHSGQDVTWQRDLTYFEQAAAAGEISLENDWWISAVLHNMASSA
jgi:scyllo-inositol 2-dehydrogenase (NADP+)